MTNTRSYSNSLALAASEILAASGADITQPVKVLPMAKQLAAQTGCHITTAKSHISRAVRLARGATQPAAWGGTRPGAGRPRTIEDTMKTRYRITFVDNDGETKTVIVSARNTFEAVQLAGAFNRPVLSLEDLDA